MNLTPSQLKVAADGRRYWFFHAHAPTLQAIGDMLGVGKVSIFEHVATLRRKGVLSTFELQIRPGVRLPDETRATKMPVLGEVG